MTISWSRFEVPERRSPAPVFFALRIGKPWNMCAASVNPDTPSAARPRRSLSGKLLWLTIAFVLLTEILGFLPGLVGERRQWLTDRITQAHIAALSVDPPPGGSEDPVTRNELLRLAGVLEIRLQEPDRNLLVLQSDPPAVATSGVDLRREDFF